MLVKTLSLLLAFGLGMAWAAADVNRATEAELDGIKGLGPAQTRRILAEREKGHFNDWADLQRRVKGMGQERSVQLSDQGLRVNGLPHPWRNTPAHDHPARPVTPSGS